jgi:hypothetical protein
MPLLSFAISSTAQLHEKVDEALARRYCHQALAFDPPAGRRPYASVRRLDELWRLPEPLFPTNQWDVPIQEGGTWLFGEGKYLRHGWHPCLVASNEAPIFQIPTPNA